MDEQQVLRIARPAAYWARRAAYQHKRGNSRQAEILYQHAVTLTPDDTALKLAYARVLQEAHRHELSLKQAFAALAQDMNNPACVALIGQNLMAMGYLHEAADAYARVLSLTTGTLANTFADQLDRLETLLYPQKETGLRYRVLVQRAAQAIAAGSWEQARQLLERACAMPRRDERCHTLAALCDRAAGDMKEAIVQGIAACEAAPYSTRTYCTLAELYHSDQQHDSALDALLHAAARMLTAEDERLLCHTAIKLHFPTVPLQTLSRFGNSIHTLYNQSVLWLHAGFPQRALPLLERCRALDPDDIPVRYLFKTAQAIAALPPKQATDKGKEQRLYPALSDADSEACFRTFMQTLEEGLEPFFNRLQSDSAFYRLVLYQAQNPHIDISSLLEQGFGYLKENFTQKLLHELLTMPMGGVTEKQLAIQRLTGQGNHPYVLWHDGQLSFVQHPAGEETAVLQRLREHVLHIDNPALATYALALIGRMPPRMRRRMAAAKPGVFLAAVQIHYTQTHPAAAQMHAIPSLSSVLRIYNTLTHIAPVPDTAAAPTLWLSGNREENQYETD